MKVPFLKRGILLLAAVAYISLSFAQKDTRVKRSSTTNTSNNSYLNINENHSANPGETLINYRNGAERYTIKMTGEKITELYVDDKKIPADSFYLYNSIIEKIKEQVKKDKEQAEEDRKQAEKDRAQAMVDRQQAEKDRAQADLDRKQAEKDREQAMKDREQSLKDRARSDNDRGGAEASRKQAEKDREQAVKDRAQAELDREQAGKDREQAVKDRAQAELDRKQAEKDRKQAEEDRAMVKSLMDEIVKQNLVTSETAINSLVLSDEEFTINGKKQSEEVHKAYKAKYLKKSGYSISYGYRSGYGTTINIGNNKKIY
jgi:hypothetical protein